MQTLQLNQLPGSTLPPLPPQSQEPPQQNQQPQPAQSQPQPAEASQQPASSNPSPFIPLSDFKNHISVAKESTAKVDAPDPEGPVDPAGVPPQPGPQIFTPVGPAAAPERPPMDDTEARKQAITFMKSREYIQSGAIAWWADGNMQNMERYNYSPKAFNNLVDAWAPVLQQFNIRIPKGVNILFAELYNSGPVFGLMAQNRKMRKQNEAYAKRIQQLEKQVAVAASSRKPTKTQWKVDKNGYFEYTPANTYIATDDRSERPELTEENYKLLVEHNGADYINKVYNLNKKA